jgi:hypothetical protein
VKLTDFSRNLQADAIGTAFDGGTGILEGRTGAAPTNAGDALTGTVVYTVAIPSDSFGAASAGVVSKAGTWQDASADNAGTVGHCVMRKSGDTTGASNSVPRVLLTVGAGSGEVSHDNLVIGAGQVVTVNTFTFTQPAS